MGELEGVRNAWGYAEGGNGAISLAIAKSAQSHGALIFPNSVSTPSLSLICTLSLCLLIFVSLFLSVCMYVCVFCTVLCVCVL